MKLSQLNERTSELKAKRQVLHDELHGLVNSDELTVRQAAVRERKIRAKIIAINKELAPLENERAEIDRMTKGKPRKQKESHVDEEITLG